MRHGLQFFDRPDFVVPVQPEHDRLDDEEPVLQKHVDADACKEVNLMK
jgi:hypothetical protein